ncbi:alpha/beta hydrolase [Streptomyces sp. DG2A-72]|uniref:alpha/beta hydrolase n=1 Tax=Streptomyces sp. DG2A-72 TaxID=3051386 RepID=UPI00265BC001|nr:alpha/beta hydrolase [Streptomyces sp. DG2A-72]MDO0934869.1 alpha/beta hydrolase [Streptomyces sp. DG2A-72]
MFTFDVAPAALFEERARQFTAWGIPARTVARARDGITDMWGTGPGGWVPVWGQLAREAEAAGQWLRAAHLWGAARFPALATPERHEAYERQHAAYARATAGPRLPVRFARGTMEVPLDGGTVRLPVHLMARRRSRRPGVLMLSGGVDTWKVELHRMAVATALATGLLVVCVDMPGTGEAPGPLAPDADRLLSGLVAEIRRWRPGEPVAYLGLSFGGHWAVKLAVRGVVDAAVDIGGPTGAAGPEEPIDVLGLPCGMPGILGNALGLESLPEAAEIDGMLDAFSLRRQGLLGPGADSGVPLLAANGAHDQFIPRADTTRLADRPGTTVWIVPGATHCAAEHIRPLLAACWAWLLTRPAFRRGHGRARLRQVAAGT